MFDEIFFREVLPEELQRFGDLTCEIETTDGHVHSVANIRALQSDSVLLEVDAPIAGEAPTFADPHAAPNEPATTAVAASPDTPDAVPPASTRTTVSLSLPFAHIELVRFKNAAPGAGTRMQFLDDATP